MEPPLGWEQRVNNAMTYDELDALYQEAVRGGFANRSRYLLVKRNQASLGVVNKLMADAADKAFRPLDQVTQQGAGGLFRATIPGLIDQFGNVNAQIAKDYYETQRQLAWTNARILAKDWRRAADRRAQAQLSAQLALFDRPFTATIPKFDVAKEAEPIIGYGMSLFQKLGAQASHEVTNALTRAVAIYNRDTILYNSALDPAVVGVQRVPEPNACDFCKMVARDRYGNERISGYAAHYHNHCKCTIETVYAKGESYKAHHPAMARA